MILIFILKSGITPLTSQNSNDTTPCATGMRTKPFMSRIETRPNIAWVSLFPEVGVHVQQVVCGHNVFPGYFKFTASLLVTAGVFLYFLKFCSHQCNFP